MSENLESKLKDNRTIIIAALIIAAAIIVSPIIKHYFPAGTQAKAPTPGTDARTALMNPVTKDDHIRGNKNAKITIVEYADTECPYCMRAHDSFNSLLKKYPNDVRWVYRHFPFHQYATLEANISECIADEFGNDAFWAYLDALFLDTDFRASRGQDVAVSLDYWTSRTESCVDEEKFGDKVAADDENGVAIGVQGTPYNIVIGPDGTMLPIAGAQPESVFDAIIKKLIK